MSEHNKPTQKQASPMVYALALGLAACAGFLAVYGVFAPKSNDLDLPGAKTTQSDAADTGQARKNRGKMVGFVYKKQPVELPDITFKNAENADVKLSDWKGKTVLLNLWATWCAPCRKEMPALDRLKKELEGDGFDVVALSIDRSGLDKPKEFLEKIGVASLALYNDKTATMAAKLKVMGMPTTILIGADGKEIGRLTGPAEWDAPEAIELIKAELNKSDEAS